MEHHPCKTVVEEVVAGEPDMTEGFWALDSTTAEVEEEFAQDLRPAVLLCGEAVRHVDLE